MADERRIFRVAEALLDATVKGIEAQGYDAPATRFVSPGIPAFDDEMICVSCPRIAPMVGDAETARAVKSNRLHQRGAEYIVWLVISAPLFHNSVGTVIPPSADEMNETSERLYGSLLAGINGVLAEAKGAATDVFNSGQVTFLDSVTAGPEGGFSAQLVRWRIDLAPDVS